MRGHGCIPLDGGRQRAYYGCMRIPSLLWAAALLAAATCQASTLWVKGVTAERGWYDADKSLERDGDLCWGSTAANMVAWWQDLHPRETAASGAPAGITAVWDAMRTAFLDNTGSTYHCLRWWMDGTPPPPQMRLAPGAGGGRHAPAPLRESDVLLYKAPAFDGTGDLSATLRGLLERGYSVALGLRQYDADGHELLAGGHMVSLWGLEFDKESGRVTRLYLTDSDDVVGNWPQHQKGLFAADCTPVPDLRYAGGTPFPGLTLTTALGWFRPNTTITTIVALHADAGCHAH